MKFTKACLAIIATLFFSSSAFASDCEQGKALLTETDSVYSKAAKLLEASKIDVNSLSKLIADNLPANPDQRQELARSIFGDDIGFSATPADAAPNFYAANLVKLVEAMDDLKSQDNKGRFLIGKFIEECFKIRNR